MRKLKLARDFRNKRKHLLSISLKMYRIRGTFKQVDEMQVHKISKNYNIDANSNLYEDVRQII